MTRAQFGNGVGRESRKKKQLIKSPQMSAQWPQSSADVSYCLDYGVRGKRMDGVVKRRKLMEHPVCSGK